MTNSFQLRTTRVMRITIAVALAAAVGLLFMAGSRTSAEPVSPPQPTTPMQIAPPDLPKIYMPGLGEFMLVVQNHHAKLWLAARARNWPLAEYQLSEMKEVLSEVQELVPQYKSVPVGQMIDAITTGSIAELEKAIEEKKFTKFTAAFDKLTAACNNCHKAARRGFVVIQRPARATFPNQDFRPARR